MRARGSDSPILRELARVGLDLASSPVNALSTADADHARAFLAHLCALSPGATWRDVFPDLPAHWDLADPDTWTYPYRPMGAFDYPTLPTGPAVHVTWPKSVDAACLDRVLSQARAAGFLVYGGGFAVITNPEWPTRNAHVILVSDTTLDELFRFQDWIDAHADATCVGISRTGEESYAP